MLVCFVCLRCFVLFCVVGGAACFVVCCVVDYLFVGLFVVF